ncbi:MAG TPA: polymorphic toxin-type HINT domain-containing protein, partial [Fimbriimonas sp.]|nr:polymorphic toxin-type HINT domain-containing protein [Fimbriimonas sp.]
YDVWGRPVTYTNPDSTTCTVGYNANGQVMSQTDELNHTTTYSYNDAGQLVGKTNAKNEGESYAYDDAGRRTSVTNGRNKTRTYTYTNRGEVALLTLPDSSVEEWAYNGAGDCTGYENPLGQTIYYTFDDAGRQTGIDYPTGTDTTFSYDNADRATYMVDSSGTSSWTYDYASQVTQLVTPQGTLTYAYDDAGRRTSMADATGTTSYGYDDANRLTSLVNPHNETTTWVYDNADRVTRQNYHSGAYVTYAFDNRDRVTDIRHRQSGGTNIVRETYVWGNSGNLTSKTIGSNTVDYTYDAIDQLLTEVRGTYSASYTYDGNGNRLTKTLGTTTDNYAYDDGDKLTAITRGTSTLKSFDYDAAGRTTSITTSAGTTSLGYDYEGRITGITYPNSSTNSFGYNGLDTRVSKSDSNGNASYRRDGADVTSPILSDSTSTYTTGISVRTGSTSTFQHADWIGTNFRQSDASQTVSSSLRFDAFGGGLTSSGTHVGGMSFGGAWGYQSDVDSGLKLLGHRYYDSSTGRFMTRDRAKDGRNWYTYCASNPTRFIDSTGQWLETAFDVVMLAKGIADFIEDPSLENGVGVVADVVFLIAPLPNVGAIRHLDDVGDAVNDLRKIDPPPGWVGGGSNQCFAAGTLVAMSDGSFLAIEKIKAGDTVLSRAENANASAPPIPSIVAQVFKRESRSTLVIQLEDGKNLEVTEEHPLYVDGVGFTPAKDLRVGQRLKEDVNESVEIKSIEGLQRSVPVYNFEVVKTHTYFIRVGDDSVWVHNACRKPTTKLRREWEDEHGYEWPLDQSGKPLEAAHVKALADGGVDNGTNIIPLPVDLHRIGPNAVHVIDGDFRRWGGR